MATRHEITSIQFKADAGKANAAIDSIRQKAKEANDQMTQLRQKLEEGRKANLPIEDLKKMEDQLKSATKEAKQWGDAQRNLMRGVKALDEAIIQFNRGQGSVEKMSAALSKAARNAAQLQQSRMERGSQGWQEMEALITALDKNLVKARQDFDGLVQTIEAGGRVSVSELSSAKQSLKELSDLTAYGSKEWKAYDAQLTTVSEKLREMAIEQQRATGKDTLGRAFRGDFAGADAQTLEQTITKLKEYQSVIDDPRGKGARHFAAAETQIKQLQSTLDQLKGKYTSADEVIQRFNQHLGETKMEHVNTQAQTLAQTLDEKLSQATSEWDEDIQRETENLNRYEQELKETQERLASLQAKYDEVQQRYQNRSALGKATLGRRDKKFMAELDFLINGDDEYIGAKGWVEYDKRDVEGAKARLKEYKELKAEALGLTETVEQLNQAELQGEEKKQEARRMTREQMQQGIKVLEDEAFTIDRTTAEGKARYEQLRQTIDQMNEEIKVAANEMMSLADAQALADKAMEEQALTTKTGWAASTEELKRAEQTLAEKVAKAKRGTAEEEAAYQKLVRQLQAVRTELGAGSMSGKQMMDVLSDPKNVTSVDTLKAAIGRARQELDALGRRLDQAKQSGQTGEVQKLQKTYDELANSIQQTDIRMKELQNSSKGTVSAFDKAWSRLKTYVGLYVGAAVAMQKLSQAMGDLLTLSDKMGEVRKTTGFTADEVGRLSENLAKLDTRTTLTELMEISAAAGTLGLKAMEDVEGFTEAANKLMVALPEMGKDAATSIMRVALATGEIDKIRQQMQDGVIEGSSATAVAMEKIGSTIDRLRASSASTAPAITDFVSRVGAVGAQSNISIDQVAALGSTISSLGMRVEMSATALSRMIPAIKNNAFDVARAIGMAPEALREMFDEAGGGMNAMLAIFQHIKDSGMDAENIEQQLGMGGMADIMKDLNQQGARAGIVFAGLSQNVDELRRQLGIAHTAYEENIAIQEEYDRMNETTAAKWERLKNQVEEMFVGDSAQSGLGVLIDWLRKLVDLVSGPLNTAFFATVSAVSAIKLGLTSLPAQGGKILDYLRESAARASEALEKAANSTNAISQAAQGVEGAADAVDEIGGALEGAQEAGEQAGNAMETATGAIQNMTGATKVSIFSVNGLKAAWRGLDTTMKANIIVAVLALLWTLGKAIYNVVTEVTKANKALGEANAMIQIAIDRFEGYWQKLQETASALDRAKQATQGLKEGSDELTKATVEVTKADNAHRTAIADINGIYGKYLGFMLTEANYANLNAVAHDKVAAAIRREMLAKQQQAAIDQVTQEHTEKLKDDLSSLSEELRENNRLTNEQAAQAKSALQQFLRQNIKYDANQGEFVINQAEARKLQKQGYDVSNASTKEFIAVWFNQYLKDTFHLDKSARQDITGIAESGNKGWGTYLDLSNLRGDYADTYLDYLKDMALTQDVFAGEMSSATKEDREATQKLLKKLQQEADAAKKKITNKSTSEQERNKAYEELANALEGMDGSIDQLDPKMDKQLIADIKAQANNISKAVDKDKLIRARTNARSIFARATGGDAGYTPEIPLTPEKNPWGERLPAESTDWRNMTAEQLVNRRKQMRDFVNAIQTDSDVKTVLKEDAALRKAIEKGMSSDMRTVIEWYNTERLKIQDELHARHLTNTGDWMDPTKQKARAKVIKDEWSTYLNELDAYYTERKAKIQEQQNDGEISEAESWRRQLTNEAEWRQRRAELQQLYARKSAEVTEEEQQAIFNIIGERTGDSADFIRASIAKTVQFIYDIGKHSEAEMNNLFGRMDKGSEQDFLRQRNAIGKQMDAIRDIIEKERPFNGITENLQENLTKMGVLFGDMDDELKRLMAAGEDMEEFNAKQEQERVRRLSFLLQEAEHAYNTNIEEVMRHMAEAGMTAWVDYFKNNTDAQNALMAQLHTTFDKVQEAIKKEASLWKKEAENMWNNILLPDGETTLKQLADRTVAALSLDENRVKRANSLIGAGQASERVADRLALQQMRVQLAMQEHYYNIMHQRGRAAIDDLERQAKLARERGDIEEATRKELDAQHARMTLNLATAKEETDLAKQREEIIARTEESQNRLYTAMKEWADLLSSSLQSVFEATHAGDAEYFNERAKLNLTGKGGPGAGTYIVIDNEGTSDATAHYEYLNEREALERQREIANQNALADALKKALDDINMKMSEQITDWINASLQSASLDANTQAVLANTEALYETNGGPAAKPQGTVAAGGNGRTAAYGEGGGEWMPPMEMPEKEPGAEYVAPWTKWAEVSSKATETMVNNNKKVEKSTKASFAAMTAAANMYGIAYQAMSNENLSTTQKVEMMIVQAAGQAAISMLTASLAASEGETAANAPSWISKTLKELGPIGGPVAVGVFTALIGGLMGLATSKITKSKSEIAQVTGASHASAGRLSTGMLQYAEGNVNEFTDPSTLQTGKQYNVDAADGRTYRARFMGKGAKTHITHGPEFHLVGEAGREAIIDAKTTQNIRMNEPEIWRTIQILSGGGRISAMRRRGRGVAAFADGNVDEMGGVGDMGNVGGMSAELTASLQASLDRNSDIMERIAAEGIKAFFDVYGKDGLVETYDRGKKTMSRYGKKY